MALYILTLHLFNGYVHAKDESQEVAQFIQLIQNNEINLPFEEKTFHYSKYNVNLNFQHSWVLKISKIKPILKHRCQRFDKPHTISSFK